MSNQNHKNKLISFSLKRFAILMVSALLCALLALYINGIMASRDIESGRSSPGDIPGKYSKVLDKFKETPPERVISLSPSTTELIYEIGVQDRLVGAAKPHDYPPEALNIPTIGDVSLNIEKIVSLHPDILIGEGNEYSPQLEKLKESGIPVIFFDTRQVSQVFTDVKVLEILFHKKEQSEKFGQYIYILDQIKNRSHQKKTSPRVAAVISSAPITVAARDSYLANLIKMSGGINVTNDIYGDKITLSARDLALYYPQVIICMDKRVMDELLSDPALKNISAIKYKRVYEIPPDLIHPTLRSIEKGTYKLVDLFFYQDDPGPSSNQQNDSKDDVSTSK
jgi:iron complex transport system substrate-binding protein